MNASRLAIAGAISCAAVACGGDTEPQGQTAITTEQVFDFTGLGVDSCFAYTFQVGGVFAQTATVVVTDGSVNGIDPFPGRTVRRWTLIRPGARDLERIYEGTDDGELFILQEVSGTGPQTRVTREFVDPSPDPAAPEANPPLRMRILPRIDGTPRIDPVNRFSTTTVPQSITDSSMTPNPGTATEVYQYVVQSSSANFTTDAGDSYTGINFSFTIDRGADSFSGTEFYTPNVGLVQFNDEEGTDYELVDFFLNLSDGTTAGTMNCP